MFPATTLHVPAAVAVLPGMKSDPGALLLAVRLALVLELKLRALGVRDRAAGGKQTGQGRRDDDVGPLSA